MKKIYTILLVLLVIELVLVFICGPHSCEWGGQVYFYFGIASLIIPTCFLAFQKGLSLSKKLTQVVGVSLLLVITWVIGFMLGDFRIMCRLF